MSLLRFGLLAVTLWVLLGSAPAGAVVISFEGASGFAFNTGDFLNVGDFRFTDTDVIPGGFLDITNQSNIVQTGTTKLFSANHADVTMTRIDGSAFNLDSFDIGGSFIGSPNRFANEVTVTGNIQGGGSVVHVISMTDLNTYQSVDLPETFANLLSVVFHATLDSANQSGSSSDFEFTLDNLVATSVPEPGTLLLVLSGLVLVGMRKRLW